mgnify:CR=1 FL=1
MLRLMLDIFMMILIYADTETDFQYAAEKHRDFKLFVQHNM